MIVCDFFEFFDAFEHASKLSDLDVYCFRLSDSLTVNFATFSLFCHYDDFAADSSSYVALMRNKRICETDNLHRYGTYLVCGRRFSLDMSNTYICGSYLCKVYAFDNCNFSIVDIFYLPRTRKR
ncbi:MAG: hypothetical protein [Microviridae sp.]|nr:MAG: hypothetical protein [Microviridae sp.]